MGSVRDLHFELCLKCQKKGHFIEDIQQISAGLANSSWWRLQVERWSRNFETTPKINENVKSIVGIHSVTCDTAVYVPGRVRGTLLTSWLILVQQ